MEKGWRTIVIARAEVFINTWLTYSKDDVFGKFICTNLQMGSIKKIINLNIQWCVMPQNFAPESIIHIL